ncbi:MAG: hypothetical protein CME63_11520 [Halobacteriovoraceae bacterium]|nr:hypothetical protein [Halobacteriovoraceae bacterium]MBC98373.1 hypothetical protein [Halobacteriovoraceae bacterium]|tara:strand:+ start:2482 stop:4083 length:1602 start_codon:yes stop_codon:yes gene_type:complete
MTIFRSGGGHIKFRDALRLGLAYIFFIFPLMITAETTSMEGAKILEISSSKKSLILDKGYAEGFVNGDRAKFYVKDLEEGVLNPRFHYVAEGELIKLKNRESFWFLRKIERFQDLVESGQIVMVRQARDPRRPFVAKRTLKVKGRASDQEYYEVNEDAGIPEDLIFEEGDFFMSDKLVDTKPTKKQNLEISRKSPYVKIGKEYDEDFDQERNKLMTPSDEGDRTLIRQIKKKAKEKVWDSTARPSVEKYNDLKYGLKGLYAGVKTDPSTNVHDSTDFLSVSERRLIAKREREKISPEVIERIKREGPRWSQGMDDDQLRQYLITTGIEGELRRQKEALEDKPGHELILRYTSGLQSFTTDEDPNNRGTDYAIGMSYEWHLKGTYIALDYWTLEFGLERGISHYDVGGVNARITEGSLKGFANYYLWNKPSSIRKYMPYIGFGVKRGNGDLESFSFDKVYRYQLLSVPTAHLGIKYRFQSGDAKDESLNYGLGVNFQLVYESLRYNSQDVIEDDIDSVIEVSQFKFTVGMNIYF